MLHAAFHPSSTIPDSMYLLNILGISIMLYCISIFQHFNYPIHSLIFFQIFLTPCPSPYLETLLSIFTHSSMHSFLFIPFLILLVPHNSSPISKILPKHTPLQFHSLLPRPPCILSHLYINFSSYSILRITLPLFHSCHLLKHLIFTIKWWSKIPYPAPLKYIYM